MVKAGSRFAVCGAVMLALSGCIGSHKDAPRVAAPSDGLLLERIVVPQKRGESSAALQSGLDALTSGEWSEATRQIGLAISLDPRNPGLHFLNGLIYQLRASQGETHLVDLAENGFVLALQHQPDYVAAALQLARLYFTERRWPEAQRAAALVMQVEPDNADATRLLAASSYYIGDTAIGLWAMRRAAELDPEATETRRLEPLIYSAAGLDDEAKNSYDSLIRHRPDADRSGILQRRLMQWREFHKNAKGESRSGQLSVEGGAVQLAQFGQTPSAPSFGSGPVGTPFGASPPPATPSVPTSEPQGPVAPSWSDCPQPVAASQGTGYSSSSYSSYGSTTGDETTALPALPSPCHGRPLPRMAMIDAVMLRTDDVTTNARGVNLLDGLTIFVQNSITSTRTYGPRVTSPVNSSTILQSIGLGSTANGGIAYSLNIANASDQRADILARPTLLVLDRQPAQFFSGSSVSVALVSTQGGGNISDKPVGVSLSVTPTFIDDETILVNVKAARSFFESTASTATFAQSVQTSRNVVQASVIMKFNQTLILSGLSERELTENRSGVPILRDLPGVQYFFNRQTESDFTKSVLILLTPRKVSSFNDAVDAAENAERISRAAEPDPEAVLHLRETALKDLGGIWPNVVVTLGHLEKSNRFFQAIRTGDIRLEEWPTSARLQRLLEDAISLIYH